LSTAARRLQVEGEERADAAARAATAPSIQMVEFGRIQKELREIASDTASGVAVDVVGDNLQTLTGAVPGPKDTPYDGGLFRVAIELDDQYPFVPPRMRFKTRVWHPNVSSGGGGVVGVFFVVCRSSSWFV
jgi:hypothetical protein